MLVKTINLFLIEIEHKLYEPEHTNANELVSSLSIEDHTKCGKDCHQLREEFYSDEVKGTKKGEENHLNGNLAAIVALDLLWFVNTLEQQHVDHG